MQGHGIEDHAAAQEGLMCAIAIDYLLLVDGFDVMIADLIECLSYVGFCCDLNVVNIAKGYNAQQNPAQYAQ